MQSAPDRYPPAMFSILACCASLFLAAEPPSTARKTVTDTYHGVSVTDDYRWLENWNDPAVKAWSESQNAFARSQLDKLPAVDQIRARVTQIMSAQAESYGSLHEAGGKIFAIKRQPPKQQPMLVVMNSAFDPDTQRVLVDPNTMDPKGLTSIDWAIPSHDGTLVAVSLSSGGSESGDVHVFEVASGKDTGDVVARVNGGTAGGSLAWAQDNKGFFYTRYPRAGERPAQDMDFYTQVYFHALGSPKDVYEIGGETPKAYVKVNDDPARKWMYGRKSQFEFTRIAEIWLQSDPLTGRVLCSVQHGDGGTFAHYVREPNQIWRHIADYDDNVIAGTFGKGDEVYFISRDKAPKGKVVSLKLEGSALVNGIKSAKELIPEGKDAIVSDFWDGASLVSTPRALFVTYQMGGPTEIRCFDHHGSPAAKPEQAQVSDSSAVTPLHDGTILFNSVSYLKPAAWYHFDPANGGTRKTALEVKAPVNFDDCEIVREFATSKDGTKVPVNILMPKGTKLDGSAPCLVTGYGGYGVNITPGFSAIRRVLMDQGFVWAEVNLRGGGEFGDDWHRQGALVHKQNVFDDFYAACKHMIDRKYTSAERLGIEGGSNGGLLMGATLTQHPDVCRAVISHVGIYDMLRVELSSNGAFNIPEFGTVKDKDQFNALYAYSPLHHVKDGAHYPSILFLTGANDPRVDPMQSRKMTARLQEAKADVLLRTSASSGHGIGTALSERIEQNVDCQAWLLAKLGVQWRDSAK